MKIKIIYFFIFLMFIVVFNKSISVQAFTTETNSTTSSSVSLNKNSDNFITVFNESDFFENLSQGNNIILNNDIEINSYEKVTTSSAVTINTNGNKIKICSSSFLEFNGPFQFYSDYSFESNDSFNTSIFTCESRSFLSLSHCSLNLSGNNSIGFYLSKDCCFNLYDSTISIKGNNNTGIYSNIKIDDYNNYIYRCLIDIDGSYNKGIYSNDDVRLLFDNFKCKGKNSVSVTAPNIILDCSNTNDILKNCKKINRTVSATDIKSEYQAAVNLDNIHLPKSILLLLKSENDDSSIEELSFPINWDYNYDYNTIGEYTVYGTVLYPDYNFNIKNLPEVIETKILVKDPDILDISYLYAIEASKQSYNIIIELLKFPLESNENKLFYSTDNLETWIEYSDDYDLNEDQLHIYYLQYNKDYYFKYILSDGTTSNILKINMSPDGILSKMILKGDRDGGDLGENSPSQNPTITKDIDNKSNSNNNDDDNLKNNNLIYNENNNIDNKNTKSIKKSSSNLEIFNTDSDNTTDSQPDNIIIMNDSEPHPTFVNETLETPTESVQNIVVLSKPNDLDLDVNSPSSNYASSSKSYENENYQSDNYINETNDINSEEYLENEPNDEINDELETSNKITIHENNSDTYNENTHNKYFQKILIPLAVTGISLILIISFIFIKKRIK